MPSAKNRGRDEATAGFRNVEVAFAVADAIGPAKQKTEKRPGEKHDAKGEHRFAPRLARCWIRRSHGSESTFVNQCRARSNYFVVQNGRGQCWSLVSLQLMLVLIFVLVLDFPALRKSRTRRRIPLPWPPKLCSTSANSGDQNALQEA